MREYLLLAALAFTDASVLGSKLLKLRGGDRQLINDPKECVAEKLEAMTLGSPTIRKLHGYDVLVRAALDRCKVAVISGGGSGHEPSHAGWVAEGMLTAAVIGPVFTSPTAADVLAAIEHCTGDGGCLLVVKNYPTDIDAFREAMEQAKADGLEVEMVVVADGCAAADQERFGVAGTCFVHKIAGAAAEASESLAQVTKEAKEAAAAVCTASVVLRNCNVPGQEVTHRIKPGKMEIGVGIHDEPGTDTKDIEPADKVVEDLMDYIQRSKYLPLAKNDKVVLMVNNLGSASVIEVQVVTGQAIKLLSDKYQYSLARVFSGSFMTALDMHGMSISVLKATDQMLARLDAPTSARFWPAKPAILSPVTSEPKRKPTISKIIQ